MDEPRKGEDPESDHSRPVDPDNVFMNRVPEKVSPALAMAGAGGGALPPADDEDEEEDGMLRMSFMGHLEELRSRIIRALVGLGVAFLGCLVFSLQLWEIVQAPGLAALKPIHGKFV